VESCDYIYGCIYTPTPCPLGSRCTNNSCDPIFGCEYLPVDCQDGNPCTNDSCSLDFGCIHNQIQCASSSHCSITSCLPADNSTFFCAEEKKICIQDLSSVVVGSVVGVGVLVGIAIAIASCFAIALIGTKMMKARDLKAMKQIWDLQDEVNETEKDKRTTRDK